MQLFLCGFEFFVCALKFFVGRLHFLIDDLDFLVRCLLVLQHGLKRLAHAGDLLVQTRHALFGGSVHRILQGSLWRGLGTDATLDAKEHMEKPLRRRRRAEGNHFNRYIARSSSLPENRAPPLDRRPAFHRLLERGAHVDDKVPRTIRRKSRLAAPVGCSTKGLVRPRNSITRKSESIVTPHGLKRRSKTRSPDLRTSGGFAGSVMAVSRRCSGEAGRAGSCTIDACVCVLFFAKIFLFESTASKRSLKGASLPEQKPT